MRRQFDPDNPPDVPEGISKSTMRKLPFALVLTDPSLADNPIVFVNRAFTRVTGYSPDMALGRNCRFLQGKETTEEDIAKIRSALRDEEEVTLDLINYRANGEKFVNRLMIAPLRGDDGNVSHFLGIQNERTHDLSYANRATELDESLREIQHRVKNHLAMLLALIRMEARRSGDAQASFDVLANRVEALNLLYEEFAKSGSDGTKVALGAYVSRICSALNMLDGQRDVVVNIEVENLDAKVDSASQVGLLLSELLTNSLQHAFPGDNSGEVVVRMWNSDDEECVCLEVKDNGTGLPQGSDWPRQGNLGARIVRDLADRLDAELDVSSGDEGTTVLISIPAGSLRR